jgi:hypothetical protein
MVVIDRKNFGTPTIVRTFTARSAGVPELDLGSLGLSRVRAGIGRRIRVKRRPAPLRRRTVDVRLEGGVP